MSTLARLHALSHRYGKKLVALREIELELPAGCLVGVIGPDGVGKSTLLGLLAGIRRIQEGRVEILGLDLSRPEQRRELVERVAYMPQGLGRHLYPSLSVEENLHFFGRLFGQGPRARRARIAELLAATDLTPFADRAVSKLSGGMKQKLALCCALIHDPEVLILDEPTTGVDPLSRRRFWELIGAVRQRRPGMSLVVATAYMEEAEGFDFLVAMDAGRILTTGRAAEIEARTGVADLDRAFIQLLPEARRLGHKEINLPPRQAVPEEVPVIQAENLTRRFEGFTAVDRVSFSIHSGEIFGFLGSNGCGKTTTMRMLTGLLPPSAGEARIFGREVDAQSIEARKGVGYMSQSFSLYSELSVRQNLELHAHLFHLPAAAIPDRIAELVVLFDLGEVMETRAANLPLGLRQRLSLAVAIIHEPPLLILDEPTSGVDPIARDSFWERLIHLSRERGVTIFISTHFMNEAERCDRISLMHAGKVLAQGRPSELVQARQAENLEAAFIAYLEQEEPRERIAAGTASAFGQEKASSATHHRFSLRRLWAYALREALELRRDPIRLSFALLGPMLLLVAMGYGMSFDVNRLDFAVLDQDQTPVSRFYIESFSGSPYFHEYPPLLNEEDSQRRLQSGRLDLALEIPPDFGERLKREQAPEVGVWIEGSNPFRAETLRGYVRGVHRDAMLDWIFLSRGERPPPGPVDVATRFRYNQDFRSLYAMVPGIIMLLLILIPATMTAVGVVREKELGSITNLYATPVTGLEFLIGKLLPYIGVALLTYALLLLQAVFLFQVPIKGSLLGLHIGTILFVFAGTGLGLLMSSFVRTQIAAVFGTAIISLMPTVLFSGFISPLASLSGAAKGMGYGFPSSWFRHISVGVFTKGLGLPELWLDYLMLAGFGLVFLAISRWLLHSQAK